MTRKGLVVGLCAFGVAGVASAAPQMPAPKMASLRVMDTTPVTVRGWGFEGRERVSLLLTADGETESRVRMTTDAGVLIVRFDESLGSCERLSVRAWGSRGSRARVLTPRYQVGCLSTTRGGTSANPTR
jgi:hypothetical protein